MRSKTHEPHEPRWWETEVPEEDRPEIPDQLPPNAPKGSGLATAILFGILLMLGVLVYLYARANYPGAF